MRVGFGTLWRSSGVAVGFCAIYRYTRGFAGCRHSSIARPEWQLKGLYYYSAPAEEKIPGLHKMTNHHFLLTFFLFFDYSRTKQRFYNFSSILLGLNNISALFLRLFLDWTTFLHFFFDYSWTGPRFYNFSSILLELNKISALFLRLFLDWTTFLQFFFDYSRTKQNFCTFSSILLGLNHVSAIFLRFFLDWTTFLQFFFDSSWIKQHFCNFSSSSSNHGGEFFAAVFILVSFHKLVAGEWCRRIGVEDCHFFFLGLIWG